MHESGIRVHDFADPVGKFRNNPHAGVRLSHAFTAIVCLVFTFFVPNIEKERQGENNSSVI